MSETHDALAEASRALERERAAHRKTHRREALAQLERRAASEAAERHAAEAERLARVHQVEAGMQIALAQQLDHARNLARACSARLEAVLAERRFDAALEDLALLRLLEAHAIAVEQRALLTALRDGEDRSDLRRDAALREAERLRDDARAQAAELDARAAEIAALRAALHERSDLDHRLAAARHEADAHAERLAAELATSVDLRARVAALEETNAALAEALAALGHRCATAESTLGEVLASHSWRLTAPLRRIAAAQRGDQPAPG